MTWDPSIKLGDFAIVLATILGPILAVQAQKWVEVLRERTRQKRGIFATLMATRGARLSGEHVEALNMIELAFYGRRTFGQSNREKAVVQAWRTYLAHLNTPCPPGEGFAGVWNGTSNELFTNLLVAMAPEVGYRFERDQLSKGAYSPYAHGNLANEQNRLRQLAIEVLAGKAPIKMEVEKFPSDPAAVQAMTDFHAKLSAALDGQRTLSVRIEPQPVANNIPIGATSAGVRVESQAGANSVNGGVAPPQL